MRCAILICHCYKCRKRLIKISCSVSSAKCSSMKAHICANRHLESREDSQYFEWGSLCAYVPHITSKTVGNGMTWRISFLFKWAVWFYTRCKLERKPFYHFHVIVPRNRGDSVGVRMKTRRAETDTKNGTHLSVDINYFFGIRNFRMISK